jgi:hypothetical protein
MGVLFVLLLCSQEADVAKARERLSAAITADDVKAAREAIETLKKTDGRAFVLAMQKTRDRQRALDRALEEDHKEEARLEASNNLPALDTCRDRQSTHHSQLLHIEDIHDALREALHGLGATAMAAIVEELEKSPSWLARWEMAEALGQVAQADTVKTLLARLEKEQADLVVAQILEGIALRGGAKGEAVKPVAARLTNRAWQARMGATRALAVGGSKEAVAPLVAAITSSDGLLRLAYHAALTILTATEVGDPGRWPDWWNQNGEAFLAGSYKPPAARAAGDVGRTKFYGLEVKSTRLSVVLDRSSSMDEKVDKDGPRKIAVVKEELKGLLGALGDHARVNLLTFGDKVDGLAAAPRPLDAKCRKEAQVFIDAITPARRTNLYDAVERGLSYAGTADGQGIAEGLDTIYLLSDGEPTFGSITWSNLAIRVIRRLNRPLQVTIHCIAVGDVGTLLKTISEQNGGEYVKR